MNGGVVFIHRMKKVFGNFLLKDILGGRQVTSKGIYKEIREWKWHFLFFFKKSSPENMLIDLRARETAPNGFPYAPQAGTKPTT